MSKHPIRPAHVTAVTEILALAAETGELVFTIKEIARILKVSERTIFNLLNSGKLQSINILGARRIPASEVRRIATLGTFATPEEQDAHWDRVNAENTKHAAEELARRAATRPDLQHLA